MSSKREGHRNWGGRESRDTPGKKDQKGRAWGWGIIKKGEIKGRGFFSTWNRDEGTYTRYRLGERKQGKGGGRQSGGLRRKKEDTEDSSLDQII